MVGLRAAREENFVRSQAIRRWVDVDNAGRKVVCWVTRQGRIAAQTRIASIKASMHSIDQSIRFHGGLRDSHFFLEYLLGNSALYIALRVRPAIRPSSISFVGCVLSSSVSTVVAGVVLASLAVGISAVAP